MFFSLLASFEYAEGYPDHHAHFFSALWTCGGETSACWSFSGTECIDEEKIIESSTDNEDKCNGNDGSDVLGSMSLCPYSPGLVNYSILCIVDDFTTEICAVEGSSYEVVPVPAQSCPQTFECEEDMYNRGLCQLSQHDWSCQKCSRFTRNAQVVEVLSWQSPPCFRAAQIFRAGSIASCGIMVNMPSSLLGLLSSHFDFATAVTLAVMICLNLMS